MLLTFLTLLLIFSSPFTFALFCGVAAYAYTKALTNHIDQHMRPTRETNACLHT